MDPCPEMEVMVDLLQRIQSSTKETLHCLDVLTGLFVQIKGLSEDQNALLQKVLKVVEKNSTDRKRSE